MVAVPNIDGLLNFDVNNLLNLPSEIAGTVKDVANTALSVVTGGNNPLVNTANVPSMGTNQPTPVTQSNPPGGVAAIKSSGFKGEVLQGISAAITALNLAQQLHWFIPAQYLHVLTELELALQMVYGWVSEV